MPDTERPKPRKIQGELEELTRAVEEPRPEPPKEELVATPKEKHRVEDLVQAATSMFGASIEVCAGASHLAGWEMTTEVTEAQMREAVAAYLKIPA